MRTGRKLIAFVAIMLGGLGPADADTIQVVIDKLVFSPAEINAKVGETIERVDKDILAHTAAVRGDWDVMTAANNSASLILKDAAAVEYYCRFHPNVKRRIVVAPKWSAAGDI
jgi:plastocyanin